MSYALFQARLEDPAPGFLCKAAGRGRESERFTARITNEIHDPASSTDLDRLYRLIPSGGADLFDFYAKHDGFVLYRDTLALNFGQVSIQAAGVEIYRIADMEQNTSALREWLVQLEDADDTNCLKSAIAIGESPHSGNYFAIPVKGPCAGTIFYVDHDDWRNEPFAQTFDEFLATIVASPASLLSEALGCNARYSDGKTNTQWIPSEYLPNATS